MQYHFAGPLLSPCPVSKDRQLVIFIPCGDQQPPALKLEFRRQFLILGRESNLADQSLQRRSGARQVPWRPVFEVLHQLTVGVRQARQKIRHRRHI